MNSKENQNVRHDERFIEIESDRCMVQRTISDKYTHLTPESFDKERIACRQVLHKHTERYVYFEHCYYGLHGDKIYEQHRVDREAYFFYIRKKEAKAKLKAMKIARRIITQAIEIQKVVVENYKS